MASLLVSERLDRYYELRGERGQPVSDTRPESRNLAWIEPLVARQAQSTGLLRVDLDVQGLYCSGCVFLFEEIFRRQPGGARVVVNPSAGAMELTVDRSFPLETYVTTMERFGYVLGPQTKSSGAHDADLLVRMGVCVAIAMNSMIFGISIYAGLEDPVLLRVFQWLNFGLSCTSVAVGGSVFFRSAWRAMAVRHLHMDLPIALGIGLSFAGSTFSLLTAGSRSAYFDTLNVFIALMLVGRFLKARVIEKNRAQLRASGELDDLPIKRVVDGRVESARLRDVRTGDVFLVGAGDVVPTRARLEDHLASFSFDWISGESMPRAQAKGDVLPAGACAVGAPARLTALENYECSALVRLLPSPTAGDDDAETPRGDSPHGSQPLTFWPRLAKHYVVAVLCAATFGFAYWFHRTGDLTRAVDVTTAILTVTCPCAFGIATPLAYEMVYAGLRRAGLLIRRSGFLDRATTVRRVVFDKTGTLTTGVLIIARSTGLEALEDTERRVLYNLVARSAHPKSIAIKRALDACTPANAALFDPDLEVAEEPGKGLSAACGGRIFRVGDPAWASPHPTEGEVVFSVDGVVRAGFETEESLRADSAREVQALRAEGYDVWILSGDTADRVREIARHVGIPEDHVVAACSPDHKADWLRAHDHHDTLMLGDGLNDGPAVSVAHCAGTPAIDRPFIAARSDFYLVTSGLSPVRHALAESRRLRGVVHRNLAFAISYNALAVSLAALGIMSPVLCAILMPLSSLTAILSTTVGLSRRFDPSASEPSGGRHRSRARGPAPSIDRAAHAARRRRLARGETRAIRRSRYARWK